MKQKFINGELSELKKLTAQLYQGVPKLESVVEKAFLTGVENSRFWIEPSVVRDAMPKMKGTLAGHSLLIVRKHYAESTALAICDALFLLDSWIRSSIDKLNKHLMTTPQFNYDMQVGKLTSELEPQLDLSQVTMNTAYEDRIISAFGGNLSVETCEIPVHHKLAPSHVMNMIDNHGYSFARYVIGAAYAHGAKCSKFANNTELLAVLKPLYKKYVTTPACESNGHELLNQISSNEFIQIFMMNNPIEFHSSDFVESLNNIPKGASREDIEKGIKKRLSEPRIAPKVDSTSKSLTSILDECSRGTLEQAS